MKELDIRAEQQKMVAELNRQNRRKVLEGGRVEENPQLRALIGDNIEEVKKFRDEKKTLLKRMNDLKNELRSLESEK